MLSKIKTFVEVWSDELFLVAVVLLVGLISFGVGRLSVNPSSSNELVVEGTPVAVSEIQNLKSEIATTNRGEAEPTTIVGNKSSKIYHREDCSGAQSMAEANKIYFASVAAAKEAGFRPAGNCPGL